MKRGKGAMLVYAVMTEPLLIIYTGIQWMEELSTGKFYEIYLLKIENKNHPEAK